VIRQKRKETTSGRRESPCTGWRLLSKRKKMKKTFTLTHPKIKYARLIEAVRHDVKKYIKRERNKTLPDGVDFWDFACKFGNNEGEAGEIHLSEINKCIDKVEEQQLESFYLEILARPGHRTKKA
jgi:hypothetical protein